MAAIHDESFFRWDGNILVVNILGKPGASKDAVGKPKGAQLKVNVTAPPRNGRATDHMVAFLAPLFGVRERDIEVVFGRESIHKQLRIAKPGRWPEVFGPWAGPKASATAKSGQSCPI